MKKIILTLCFIIPFIGVGQIVGCIDGDCQNGVGTYLWENGSVSNGSWKDGKLNGIVQEIIYDDEGNLLGTYDGEMKMDEIDGWGTETLYSKDGTFISTYEGEFKNGESYGWGTETLHNKDGYIGTYVGEFKNGEYHGWGMFIYSDGTFESGNWKNGDLIE